MSKLMAIDLARVHVAIRKVAQAAIDESRAFHNHSERGNAGSLLALEATHLLELDAVQALVATLDLFERRNPRLRATLDRILLADALAASAPK